MRGDKGYLGNGGSSDGEAEEGGGCLVARHEELPEGSCMALNGLGHLPLHTVQLHRSHHSVRLQLVVMMMTELVMIVKLVVMMTKLVGLC